MHFEARFIPGLVFFWWPVPARSCRRLKQRFSLHHSIKNDVFTDAGALASS